MELQELHIDQRGAGPQGQRVTVAGVLPGVRRHLVRPTDATGGQDHRRRLEEHELARLAVVAERSGDPVAVQHQLGDRGLVEDLEPGVVVAVVAPVLLLERDDLLLQRADQLQAGAVTDVREARVLVAAEVALRDLAVLRTVEERAVRLQLPDAVRRFLGVQLGHPEVVEELAAPHGVAEVHHPVVAAIDVAHRRGGAALGHHRVRLAEQRLGDDGGLLAGQPGLDRRAQAGAAGPDDDDVVVVSFDSRSHLKTLS